MSFELGQIIATPRTLEVMRAVNVRPETLLKRHINDDWGDILPDDRTENELSLLEGFRLLSSYVLTGNQKVWIITEADRSSTAFLLPDEY